ncbi:MAG: AraC family transcriptional regulator [Marinobacter sp.]|uniref:AraC family transcriptional regulator n=1 Tax=Marinobacter sp. TaxID=50741 RepID=UPI00299F3DCD|nr:AraC family transcriptional regulator [Marinobacter sp.]MDX1633416.1 AraC family transcriptional regulator [Marinobacter sp.]
MLQARVMKLPESARHHCHEHHQLVIGVRGEAEMSVGSVGSRLNTRSACLVPTEADHDYSGNAGNHVLVIDLDPHLPALNNPGHSDYERLAPLFDRPRVMTFDSHLQNLVQLCAGEFSRAPENGAMHRHLAAGIMHCMSERLEREPRIPARHTFSPDSIRRYVLDNLHRKITVSDLAGVACLSVSRFHDMFRAMTGVTPHQFLLRIRLEQAMRLITGTSLTVAEISFRTGFSSQSALTNALRKHRGITPSALRIHR